MKKRTLPKLDWSESQGADYVARQFTSPSDDAWAAADLLWAIKLIRPKSFKEIEYLTRGIPEEEGGKRMRGNALAHIVQAFLLDQPSIPEDLRYIHATGYIAAFECMDPLYGPKYRIQAAKKLFKPLTLKRGKK